MDKIQINGEEMIKEKHTLTNPYNHHALSRYIDVYEVSANRCHSVPESGYKGTEATLVDEPAWNEKFSSYSITGATLTGNNFILNNDVTAQANYETAKNLTLQTDGHGTIAANKNSGFIGDQVTLSNTAATNYSFSGYTITGATLTGNKFNFTGSNVTAKAWFLAPYETLYSSTATVTANGNHVYDIDISKYPFTIINLRIKSNDNGISLGAADLNFIFNNSPWNNFTNTNNAWRLRSHYDYESKHPTCRTINRTSPQATWTSVDSQVMFLHNDDVTTYFDSGNRYATSYQSYTFCIDRNRNVCEEFIYTSKMGSGNLVAGNIFNGIKNVTESNWDYDYMSMKVYGCTAESQVSGVLTGGVPR